MNFDKLKKLVRVSGTSWVSQDPCPKPPDVPSQSAEKIRQDAHQRYADMLKENGSGRLEQEQKDLEKAMREQRKHIYERRRALERLEESLKEPRPEFVEAIKRDMDRIQRRMQKNQRAYDALRLQREKAEKMLVEYRTTGQIPEADEAIPGEISEEIRKVVTRGVELRKGRHTGRKALLDDMVKDKEVKALVGAIDRKTLQDKLGWLYPTKGTKGRPTKKEERQLFRKMLGRWQSVKNT